MLLMEEIERIAQEKHATTKLAVISGVGTQNYYRKMSYELDGPKKNLILYIIVEIDLFHVLQ